VTASAQCIRQVSCGAGSASIWLPGIPSTVLSGRLRNLEAAGIVSHQLLPQRGAYVLTEYGRDLEDAMVRLGLWGARSLDHAVTATTGASIRCRWRYAALSTPIEFTTRTASTN
jgi:HxlR-like helix-turn-helix protein